MRSWSIGEVARLLGVKPHVIRYWESELPLLSPPKGPTGRREYSSREIELLLKVRHLLHEKKYTVDGARQAMWEELEGAGADRRARLSEIRAELVDALMTHARTPGAGAASTEADIRDSSSHSARDTSSRTGRRGPPGCRDRLLRDLRGLDLVQLAEWQARLLAGPQQPATGTSFPPRTCRSPRAGRTRRPGAIGEEAIRRGRTAFLTVAGGQGSRLGFDGPKGMYPASPLRGLTLFALLAEKLLAARRWYGIQPLWLDHDQRGRTGRTPRSISRKRASSASAASLSASSRRPCCPPCPPTAGW